jgi:hypothetical protein
MPRPPFRKKKTKARNAAEKEQLKAEQNPPEA